MLNRIELVSSALMENLMSTFCTLQMLNKLIKPGHVWNHLTAIITTMILFNSTLSIWLLYAWRNTYQVMWGNRLKHEKKTPLVFQCVLSNFICTLHKLHTTQSHTIILQTNQSGQRKERYIIFPFFLCAGTQLWWSFNYGWKDQLINRKLNADTFENTHKDRNTNTWSLFSYHC